MPVLSLRLQLGEAAILSVDDAVRLLPRRQEDAERWLRERVKVHDLDGTPVVIWGEVLAALRGVAVRPGVTLAPAAPARPERRWGNA
jgi:hypothetical protein